MSHKYNFNDKMVHIYLKKNIENSCFKYKKKIKNFLYFSINNKFFSDKKGVG